MTGELGDPLWQRQRLAHHDVLGCLGFRLRVRATQRPLVDAARLSFGRFGVPREGCFEVTMDLVGDRNASRPLAGRPGLPFHRERAGLYVAGDGGGSVSVAALDRATIVSFMADRAVDPSQRRILLESPVWRCATYHGLTALHAATIVIAGRSVVLRGVSGAGKSTLTLAAALAGHTVLAEEVTWVDAAADRLRGAPWTVHVDQGTETLFPSLGAPNVSLPAPDPTAPGHARPLDLAPLGASLCEEAPWGPLVFLDRQAQGPAHLERLSEHAARAGFRATLMVGETTQRDRQLRRSLDILVRHGAWRLSFSEPHGALAALEEMVAHAND